MAKFIEVTSGGDSWILNLDSISRVFINESVLDESPEGGCFVIFIGDTEQVSINISYQKMKELLGLQ